MKEKLKKVSKPAIICAIAVIAVILAVPAIASSQYIGTDGAKERALQYTGITGDVVYTEAKLDFFDRVYDIEFVADGVKYELEIDASTGNVVKYEREGVSYISDDAGTTDIGLEAAKAAALTHAGISSADATFVEEKMDYEAGAKVYDLTFCTASAKYEYEIDAATGMVREFDYDAATATGTGTTGNTGSVADVGLEAAKSAALTHAGVSASDAVFVEERADYDDGVKVYDIEFYTSTGEYDYEIDAATGAVLEYDYDAENYTRPSSGTAGDMISQDSAKAIALERAGLAESDVYALKVELDWDDGRTEYEVEFRSGGYEFDVKIDAYTGGILEYERERD